MWQTTEVLSKHKAKLAILSGLFFYTVIRMLHLRWNKNRFFLIVYLIGTVVMVTTLCCDVNAQTRFFLVHRNVVFLFIFMLLFFLSGFILFNIYEETLNAEEGRMISLGHEESSISIITMFKSGLLDEILVVEPLCFSCM